MLPILSIVGAQGSGKSSLVESLVIELGKNNYRVMVIRQGDYLEYASAATKIAEGSLDIAIVDGICNDSDPRIEFLEDNPATEPDKLLAVVTDAELEADCPRFAPGDTAALAAFLQRELFVDGSRGTVLLVNGAPVPLSRFPQKMFTNTVMGMVSSLKDVDEIKSVSIITSQGTGVDD